MLSWVLFTVLTVAAVLTVISPLLRARGSDGSDGHTPDAAVYRDQLTEIDSDLARGLISEADAESARTEISRRLLALSDARDAKTSTGDTDRRHTSVLALTLAGVGIPVLSLGFYMTYGAPGLPDQPLSARLETQNAAPEISTLIAKVEERLRAHPEDGQGWDVIAPVYLKLRRYEDAARAYKRALELKGESTDRLVGYGEALVLGDNGIVGEEARKAFEKASQEDPSRVKPRFWLGISQEQDGNFREAASTWRRMLEAASPDAPWRRMVEERFAAANAKLGDDALPPPAAAQAPPGAVAGRSPANPDEPGPSREQVAAAQQMSASERSAMINQMVEGLAERLKADGNDLQGWLRLVRAYTVLGKRDKAADALKSARENFQGDEKALAQLTELAGSLGL